jgi:hypothetical protein
MPRSSKYSYSSSFLTMTPRAFLYLPRPGSHMHQSVHHNGDSLHFKAFTSW